MAADPPIIAHLRERIAAYDATPIADCDNGVVTIVCGEDLTTATGVEFREVASCFDGIGVFTITAEQARRALEAWSELIALDDAERTLGNSA